MGPATGVVVGVARDAAHRFSKAPAELMAHDAGGGVVLRGGVMAIALADGTVRPGDAITVDLPPPPHRRLERA